MSAVSFRSLLHPLIAIVILLLPCLAGAAPDLSVNKIVTPQQPSIGEPVEFEVTVTNAGDSDAIAVVLNEQLPAGLKIPVGMAAFVSQGFYDSASGEWTVGDLVSGASAVMTLPAQRDESLSSPCLINTAAVAPLPGDTVPANDSATAAVRAPGVERCVDLYLENLLFSVPQPICTDQSRAALTMWLRNRGPDAAANVSVSFTHSPQRLPNFRFLDNDCAGTQISTCELGTIEAGGLRVLDVVSDDFSNSSAYTVTLQVSLVSGDPDYAATDNQIAAMRVVPILANSDCGLPDVGIGIGSPSCFIATAAWGSAWHSEVVTLREFRDRHLLTNKPGRAFVAWYYRHSPPLAESIAGRPAARALVRGALTPAVAAIRHPWAAGAIVALLVLSAAVGRSRTMRGRIALLCVPKTRAS